MQLKRTLSISLLLLGCIIAFVQPLMAQKKGIVVYSKGDAGSRTLTKKDFTIDNNNKPTISGTETTICSKGSQGGDIMSNISHDGKWIAFSRSLSGTSGSFGGNDYHSFDKWDVYVVRIDGNLPATPIKVDHGTWPIWGDDSDKPIKTLYFSKAEDLSIYKCTISEDGKASNISKIHSGFTTSGGSDRHFQGSPDGKKVAYRQGGTVYIKNFETNKQYKANSGCHPSWCANSEWLIHANKTVIRHDGTQKKGGIGGDYHYGTSSNLKWFVTRTAGNWEVQNKGYDCKLYNLKATDTEFSISNGVSFTGNGSWVDAHEYDAVEVPVPVPGKPSEVKTTIENANIKVTWKAPTGAAVTSYNIYRDDAKIGTATTLEYLDKTVPAGNHTYKVSAVNATGEGEKQASDVITSVNQRSTSQSIFNTSLIKNNTGLSLVIHTEASNLTGGIYDMKGQLKSSFTTSGRTTTLPLNSFANGSYIVQFNDGNVTKHKTIKISR